MVRSFLRNGRKHYGTSSSWERHDHARRQSCNTAIASFARAAEQGVGHHTGHSNQDRARGSTAFKGALDTEILVKPKGEHDLIMSCEKQKDGPEFDPMQFVKVSVEPAIVLQQVEISRRKTKLPDGEQLAMDTFYEATKGNVASAGLHITEWRPLFNERHTGDNQKSKNTAFSRARSSLTQKGLLKCSDDVYSLGDKAT